MWMWYTVIHPKVNLALKIHARSILTLWIWDFLIHPKDNLTLYIHAEVNPYIVDLGDSTPRYL